MAKRGIGETGAFRFGSGPVEGIPDGGNGGANEPESASGRDNNTSQPAGENGTGTSGEFSEPSRLYEPSADNAGAGGPNAGRARDPVTGRTLNADGSVRAQRGTRGRRSKEEIPTYLSWLVGPIMMAHEAAATWSKCDELELDQQEAEKLCEASDRVLAFYHKEPSPEVKVWLGFATAISIIYGPRIVAIRIRLKREAEEIAKKKVHMFRTVSPTDAFPPPEPVA